MSKLLKYCSVIAGLALISCSGSSYEYNYDTNHVKYRNNGVSVGYDLDGGKYIRSGTASSESYKPNPSHGYTGHYKVGNPYVISGVEYYPHENPDYHERGTASWYGEEFYGKKTANGEIYNMYDMTAAHRTLPLPSVVEVTNLDNGKKVIVRVNDRGPFVKNRIIDVSKAAADALGFRGQGTTHVEVKFLENETNQLLKSLALK